MRISANEGALAAGSARDGLRKTNWSRLGKPGRATGANPRGPQKDTWTGTMGALSSETHHTVVTVLGERQRAGSCKGTGSELRALSSDGRRSSFVLENPVGEGER